MQSTTHPPDGQQSEFIHQYTLRLQRAKLDAVDVLHRLMLQLVEVLTTPPEPETKRSLITTQRMRLAHRTAIDLINTHLPGDPPAPRSPRTSPSPPSPAPPPSPRSGGEGAPRLCEGRMRVPFASSSSNPTATTTLTTAAASSPLPQISAVNFQLSDLQPSPLSPTPVLPLSSPSPPHDSRLSTHDHSQPSLSPLPSSVSSVPSVVKCLPPRDSSLVAHTSPLPAFKPFPPRPPDLTVDELASLNVRQRGIPVPFTPELTQRLRQWHLYTDATGIKPPFDVEPERLITRKLRPSRKVLSAMDPTWTHKQTAKTGPPPTT